MLAHLKHLFIPQESNNYRARILHYQFLSLFLASLLLFQLIISSFLLVKSQVLGFASQISPEKIVELVNQERAKEGVSPLRLNPILTEAASRKAGDMFAFSYWAHTSPSGRDPWAFFKEVGYRYLYAGENLARDFSTPEAVVAAWMASSTHRENILNPKYQEVGMAVVDGSLKGVETTLVVQFFGTPVNAVVEGPPKQIPEKGVINPEATKTISEKIPVEIPLRLPVLAQADGTEKPLVNPFVLTKQASLVVILILIGGLIIDGMTAQRKKVFRLTGRSLAHVMFLTGILLVLILFPQGAIL